MASGHLRRLLVVGASVGSCAAAFIASNTTLAPVQPTDRTIKIGMLLPGYNVLLYSYHWRRHWWHKLCVFHSSVDGGTAKYQ
jgi:hypothetical protein